MDEHVILGMMKAYITKQYDDEDNNDGALDGVWELHNGNLDFQGCGYMLF